MASDRPTIGENVRALMVPISNMICGPSVVYKLYGILPSGEISEILRLYNQKLDSKATYQMLRCLLECTTVGKWQAFINALSQEGFPYIVSLLEGHTDDSELHVKRILQLFAPYLELQIDPRCLVDSLRAGDVINDSDVEEILAFQTERGAASATALLLQRIRCRLSPTDWYPRFLRVLSKKGYEGIVKEIEPDFSLDCQVMKIPQLQGSRCYFSRGGENLLNDGCGVTDEIIARNICKLKYELTKKIQLRYVLPYIFSELLQDECTQNKISNASCLSHKEGITAMLDEIAKLYQTGKWRIFVRCLQKAEYPDIASRLLSQSTASSSVSSEDRIIAIFNGLLQSHLNPEDINADLVADRVINETDRIEIQETKRGYGCKRAAALLIERMQCRQPSSVWYPVFLKTLMKCQYSNLALKIDPDFCGKNQIQHSTSENGLPQIRRVDSQAVRHLKEYVSKYEADILQRIDNEEQKMKCDIEKLNEIKLAREADLESIRKRLTNPIQKAHELFNHVANGSVQNFDLLRAEIEEEIKENLKLKIEYTSNIISVCNSRQAVEIQMESFNSEKESSMSHQGILAIAKKDRKRKDSKGSLSSASTGFIEVTWKNYSLQRNSSDDLKNHVGTSYSSCNSSRTPSPPVHNSRVSFRESIDDNPSSVIRHNMYQKINRHNRSASIEGLHHMITSIKKRRRAISESESNLRNTEEREEGCDFDKMKSISLDEREWLNKIDFDRHDAGLVYEKTFAEPKTARQRTVSNSSSMYSDTSVCPLSSSLTNSGDSLWLKGSVPSNVSNLNNCSLVFHEKFSKQRGNCYFTGICSTSSENIVVVNHSCGSVLMYDRKSKQFRTLLMCPGKYKPFRIVWSCDRVIHILSRSVDCLSKLMIFELVKEMNFDKRTKIVRIVYSGKCVTDCENEIADITAYDGGIAATCFNRHIHFIRNGQTTRVLNLKVNFTEWWPTSSAISNHKKCSFIFDIYSQGLYCFDITTGSLQWKLNVNQNECIDGMTINGNLLYLSQNTKDRLLVLNVEASTIPSVTKICLEDIKRPLALGSSKTALLITQYQRNKHRLNRTVKCF